MRDIKFRAWDGKKMYNILGFTYHHQSKYDADNNIKTIGVYFENKSYEVYNVGLNQNIEIMQFTGLHDKNGKEIYEGDIILMDFSNKNKFVVFDKQMASFRIKSHVKYSDGTFKTFGFEETTSEELEIIGNIYENQELL